MPLPGFNKHKPSLTTLVNNEKKKVFICDQTVCMTKKQQEISSDRFRVDTVQNECPVSVIFSDIGNY